MTSQGIAGAGTGVVKIAYPITECAAALTSIVQIK
jgi:hypothetical protein